MRTFILTLDYELYGDGSGNVFDLMIKPTERLLSMAEKYGIRYTFFFEVVEYWKLKEAWLSGNRMGYAANPIEAIEKQVSDIIRRGHDIQLHLHPQWLDAEYCGKTWRVDGDNWRLGDFQSSGMTLTDLIKKGRDTLEGLIRPDRPEYRCVALRAGGYNACPSEKIVRAMEECGLCIDSSLYRGGFEDGHLSRYDYSDIPTEAYWHVGNALTGRGTSSVMELPVYSAEISMWQKYSSGNLWRSFFRKKRYLGYPPLLNNPIQIAYKKSRPKKLWQTWDFCILSPRMQRFFLRKMKEEGRKIAVLVGHPKGFMSGNSLENLLKLTRNEQFITISDFVGLC